MCRGSQESLVAGCRVTEGSLRSEQRFKVLRSGEVVFEGPVTSLKRHKLEVDSVGRGTECGVLLDGFNDMQPGDLLQCITVELRTPGAASTGMERKG